MSTVTTRIRDLYRTIDAGDWTALADFFHPDIVYERPGYAPLVGLERVLRFYREERVVASGEHQVEGVLHELDRAACWGRMRGTLRDGAPTEVRFADVYSLEEDKIRTRCSYFFSPAV